MSQKKEELLRDRPFLKLYTSKDITRVEVTRELEQRELKDLYQATHISRVLEVLVYHPREHTPQSKHQNVARQVQMLVTQGLKYNKSLRIIDLENAGINQQMMASIKDFLLKNKGITHFIIGQNPLQQKDFADISEGLNESDALIVVDLTKTQLHSQYIEAFVSALSKHQSITELRMGENYLTEAAAPHIKKLVEDHKSLTYIDVGASQLGNDGVKALMEALVASDSIVKVNVSNNGLTHESAPAIAEFVSKSKSLRELDISNNNQLSKPASMDEGIAMIADALGSSSMEVLNISGSIYDPSQLGEYPGSIIAAILSKTKSIKVLDISQNSLTFIGAQLVADALPANASVGQIDMKQTGLDEAGAILLSEALETNQTVQNLGWASNNLQDAGIIFLAATLQTKNHYIRFLDLSSNNITEKGVAAICEILGQLELLNLSGNPIKQVGAEALAAKLAANQSLRELYLDETQIYQQGAVAAVAIVGALVGHYFLKILSLKGANITDHGLDGIIEPLVKNMSIVILNLAGNNFTQNSGTKLATLIRDKKSLIKLDLDKNNMQDQGERQVADAITASSLQELTGFKDEQMVAIGAILKNKAKLQAQLKALEQAEAQFTYQELFVMARSMQVEAKFGAELSYSDLKTNDEYMESIAGRFKIMHKADTGDQAHAEIDTFHQALLDSNLLGTTE